MSHCTFRVGEFIEAMTGILSKNIIVGNDFNKKEDLIKWFSEGINGEILSPNKEWKNGKVRIKVTLEFCPDEPDVEETPVSNNLEISEPESPLDDIRKMINEQS
ncbi:MAG: KGK family protein [Aphanothece sp. CMT-3BRIN-NPC111]|nr:KGK family protein [Aphanothece sp. CMT-3BRIN-NPC111]